MIHVLSSFGNKFLEIRRKCYIFKSSLIYTEQVSYILEKFYTVKPLFSAPPIKRTLSRGPEITVLYFPLQRTPSIKRT